jgi:type 1 fimbria pilin
MKTKVMIAATALALITLAGATQAQTSGGGGGMARKGQKLAVACSGKTENAPCSFARRDGQTVNGPV